ncbi:MAG TPA: hypothetical protein VM890_00925 [Longimicrobium sp.]|nr:hypothetical protein [Longimicrobium sp.]
MPPESVTARLVITCRYGRGPRAAPPPPWAGAAADGAPPGAAGAVAGAPAEGPPLVRAAGDGAGRPVLGAQEATVTAAAASQTMLRTM